QLDSFLDFYKRLVSLFSQSKSIKDYYLGEPEEKRKDTAERFRDGMQRRVSEAPDQLVAMVVLDATGRVDIASDPKLVGVNLGKLPAVHDALSGGPGGIGEPEFVALLSGKPSEAVIPILDPIKGKGRVLGVVALWAKAKTLTDLVRKYNPLGSEG